MLFSKRLFVSKPMMFATRSSSARVILFAIFLQCWALSALYGQEAEISISVHAGRPHRAEIRGRFIDNESQRIREIYLLDDYAGISGLASRFSPILLYDQQGFLVARRSMIAGERRTIRDFSGFAYSVALAASEQPSGAAHISWINENGGVLMLDDLFPQGFIRSAKVKLDLPVGWNAISTDYLNSMEDTTPTKEELNNFLVKDIENSVILIGKNARRRVVWWNQARLIFGSRDEWRVHDDEALSAMRAIFAEYEKAFQTKTKDNFLIAFSKFPIQNVSFGQWEAGTRGKTVNIISSDMPFKDQSIQRVREQLRHELFHLWIPNRLNLKGRYDWFYEGFALYQSLKTGVALNQIRFDDYLDTLSRARAIDNSGERRSSLIDLSRNRWSGGNTKLYARGMLAAFACDLATLRASNAKRDITEILAAIIRKHAHPASAMDAETAILAELGSRAELVPVIDQLITGNERFDFTELLNGAGLEVVRAASSEAIKIVGKPSGKQKETLKRLGSENWRNVR